MEIHEFHVICGAAMKISCIFNILSAICLAATVSCSNNGLPQTNLDGLPRNDAGKKPMMDSGLPDGSLGVGTPCTKETREQDCSRIKNPVCLENFYNGILVYPQGYCSLEGCLDDYCGIDADCVEIWVTSYCMKTCRTDQECRANGYECKKLDSLIFFDAGPVQEGTFCLPEDIELKDASFN